MKLLENTENRITKDKNGANVPHLEIIEVMSVHCNIVNNIINKIQEFSIHLFQINLLARYRGFTNKFHISKDM